MMKTAQAASRQPAHSADASSLLRPARTSFRADGKLSGMQSMHGNQRLQRMLNRGVLQAKLTINQPGDVFEQEADRVADNVMRMPESRNSENPVAYAGGVLQRMCSKCQEERVGHSDPEENRAQAKEISGNIPEVADSAAEKIEALRGRGSPMPQSERSFFELRMGQDFSTVRIHTGTEAATSASDVRALAYTSGRDIVFGEGQYQPATVGGRRLIAHELTHVIQQNRSTPLNTPGSSVSTSVQRRTASSDHLQRMGDLRQKPSSMPCPAATTSPAEPLLTSILFDNATAALTPMAIAELGAIASEWSAIPLVRPRLRIDGFASKDGSQPVNWTLSCNRALAVVTELETPTGGGPGIQAGFFDIFAQGATDEFSADPGPNRRVNISGSLPVAPIPPAGCAHPGDVRDLDLQPVFLRTGPADRSPTGVSWARRFNKANQIWGKLGVTFHDLGAVTLDTPLKTAGATGAEINAIVALRNGPGVEVFLVDNDMAADGGGSTAAGCGGGGNVVLSDRGTSDTLLAHELGHTLGLDHPGGANPADPNTVMDVQAGSSHSTPDPTRNTIGNFNRILCPPGTASTCLHPDP